MIISDGHLPNLTFDRIFPGVHDALSIFLIVFLAILNHHERFLATGEVSKKCGVYVTQLHDDVIAFHSFTTFEEPINCLFMFVPRKVNGV